MEDILYNNPIKSLLGEKPLRSPSRSLRVDIKGILEEGDKKAVASKFDPSWDELKSWLDIERDIPTKVSNLYTEDAALEYQLLLDKIYSEMPINQSETLFGIDEREPSKTEQSMFKRKLAVLEDPTLPLKMAKSGTLSLLEVDALKMFYPNYYEELSFAILEMLSENKKPLSRAKKTQIGLLLGVPRVNPETLAELQAQYQPEETEGNKSANLAEDQMTEMQKVEFS